MANKIDSCGCYTRLTDDEIVYNRLCIYCENEKKCHDECVQCDTYLKELENVKKESEALDEIYNIRR